MKRIPLGLVAKTYNISLEECKSRLQKCQCIVCGLPGVLILFHYRNDSLYSVNSCSAHYREHMNDDICDLDPLLWADVEPEEALTAETKIPQPEPTKPILKDFNKQKNLNNFMV
jgi:hypothetical protein